jgi:hypothetical protein
MQLTKNFSMKELTNSSTAVRLGIDNTNPPERVVTKLFALCDNVLQPARDMLGRLNINSGYRCLELNRALGSSDTSQHVAGEAVDVEHGVISNYELACWLRDNLDYDKIILEFYTPGVANSGWVHVTYKSTKENRKQTYTAVKENGKTVYKTGLIE